jgi:hypothetical protein
VYLIVILRTSDSQICTREKIPFALCNVRSQNEVFADSFSVSGHTNKHENNERVNFRATTYVINFT